METDHQALIRRRLQSALHESEFGAGAGAGAPATRDMGMQFHGIVTSEPGDNKCVVWTLNIVFYLVILAGFVILGVMYAHLRADIKEIGVMYAQLRADIKAIKACTQWPCF